MNKQETAKIMAIIFEAYHFFYNGSDETKAAAAVTLWSKMFADEPYRLVEAAVFAHIASSTKPPTVAHIKEAIAKLQAPEIMTEQEAANIILRAAANGVYGAKEEFEKLPPILQRVVHSPHQLKEWALMDSATVQSVIASNLMRSYRAVSQREKEIQALPESIKELLGIESIKLLGAKQ